MTWMDVVRINIALIRWTQQAVPWWFQVRKDVCRALMSLRSSKFLLLLSPGRTLTDPAERPLVDTVAVALTSLRLKSASFLNFFIWRKRKKWLSSYTSRLVVSEIKWYFDFMRTDLCFVFVELTDLLSFPLYPQQQPLLLHLKLFSLFFGHTGFHLPY